jgi:hypothetical protein
VGSEPSAGRVRPASRASSSRARRRSSAARRGRPPVAEEEAVTAAARASRRPHCPGYAPPAAGEMKKRRSPVAESSRRGKEEKEEPRRRGNKEKEEAAVRRREAASPSFYTGPCSSPRVEAAALDLHRHGAQRSRRPVTRRAPRSSSSGGRRRTVGVEPWRRAGGNWDADSLRMRSRGDLLHCAAVVAAPAGAATVPIGAAKCTCRSGCGNCWRQSLP